MLLRNWCGRLVGRLIDGRMFLCLHRNIHHAIDLLLLLSSWTLVWNRYVFRPDLAYLVPSEGGEHGSQLPEAFRAQVVHGDGVLPHDLRVEGERGVVFRRLDDRSAPVAYACYQFPSTSDAGCTRR